MRISRPQMYMQFAHVAAQRSTCCRLNVGAVIVYKRSVVSIGYNGPASGEPHCSGNSCPGKSDGCKIAVHAEDNALQHLSPDLDGPMDLYITDSPCSHCFNKIIDDGRIKRIFFQTPYRLTEHFNRIHPIEIYRLQPAGYIMNWFTKEIVDVET